MRAAALATLDVIEEEGLVENARDVGAHLKERLESLKDKHDCLVDVRGKGFMIGCEIQTEGMPDGDRADRIVKVCEAHGLLLLRCGPKKNVVRWLPPLIATRQQIDEGVDIFAKALDATV